jgi:hypothetical protein
MGMPLPKSPFNRVGEDINGRYVFLPPVVVPSPLPHDSSKLVPPPFRRLSLSPNKEEIRNVKTIVR